MNTRFGLISVCVVFVCMCVGGNRLIFEQYEICFTVYAYFFHIAVVKPSLHRPKTAEIRKTMLKSHFKRQVYRILFIVVR